MGSQQTQQAAVTGGEGTRGRVLVVDDEPMMNTTLRVALGEEHEVVTVTSGTEALHSLQTDRSFDAIICDLMMPDLSGMDIHEWLREHDPDLAERMIFMTGGAYTNSAHEFVGRIDNPNIQKPFDIDQLIVLVGDVIAAGR